MASEVESLRGAHLNLQAAIAYLEVYDQETLNSDAEIVLEDLGHLHERVKSWLEQAEATASLQERSPEVSE